MLPGVSERTLDKLVSGLLADLERKLIRDHNIGGVRSSIQALLSRTCRDRFEPNMLVSHLRPRARRDTVSFTRRTLRGGSSGCVEPRVSFLVLSNHAAPADQLSVCDMGPTQDPGRDECELLRFTL